MKRKEETMSVVKNHQGLGLPTALAIVAFVIASVATTLSYALFQSRLIEKTFDQNEDYENAVEAVDATIQIIIRDNNTDPVYLQELAEYLGVAISAYDESIWTISALTGDTNTITSYLTNDFTGIQVYEDLFTHRGDESGFALDLMINPTSLLGAYLPDFLEATFPGFNPQTEFTSFQNIVDYVASLTDIPGVYVEVSPNILQNQKDPTVMGHWYVNGNLTIPDNHNLTVPEGYLLFIDGKLTMNRNSQITGNIIVNGDLQIKSKKGSEETIAGTVYVNGQVKAGTTTYLGDVERPAFVFAEKSITLGTEVYGYGYFLADTFTVGTRHADIDITGGVYTMYYSNLDPDDLTGNPDLDQAAFGEYAVPTQIGNNDGASGGFRYTFPE